MSNISDLEKKQKINRATKNTKQKTIKEVEKEIAKTIMVNLNINGFLQYGCAVLEDYLIKSK